MVLGDPANTVLQPSMRDVMKACTRVFTDSASSDWLNGLACGDQRRLTGSGSASEAITCYTNPCTLLYNHGCNFFVVTGL